MADAVRLVVLLLVFGGHWLALLRYRFRLLTLNPRTLRHVAAQIARQFASVIGVDLGVILPARDGHVSPFGYSPVARLAPCHVDQHALGGLALAAVAGHCVPVIEMRMLADIEGHVAA